MTADRTTLSPHLPRSFRPSGLPWLLAMAAVAVAGCSAPKGFRQQQVVEEGPAVEMRAAQADAETRMEAGEEGLQGTTSSVPSLVPGEGRPVLPAREAPPATAPPEDEFDDENWGHLLARCRDRAARQQWFDAVGDCRKAAALDPSSVEPQVELMRLLVSLQSHADAEQAARKVLAASPDDDVALYYLAWSHRGRDQYDEAIAALQRAIAIAPKKVAYQQALGLTYCLKDDYGKGIDTLERARKLAPNDPKTARMLSSARTVLAQKLAPYQKLVREHSDSFDNHAALGFIYQKYGFPQKALKSYDTALTMIAPPIEERGEETRRIAAQIYYNRGVVYRQLGKPDLGEPALWQSMQLDRSLSAVAWYYIGLCRYDAGRYDESIDALRKSIDLEPDVSENRAALADAYAKAGQASRAREQRNAANAIRGREVERRQEEGRKALAAEKKAAGRPAE